MNGPDKNLIVLSPERIPNPQYNEQNFNAEVESFRQRSITEFRELLANESDPAWRKTFQGFLDGYNDPRYTQWEFIHEFLNSFSSRVDKKLQADLYGILKQHYGRNEPG